MSKKIVITAGGTGGHTFPAQGLAQQLTNKSEQFEVLFVAGGLTTNRYFDRSQFAFKEIISSPLISKNPLKLFKGMINLIRGIFQSVKILKKEKPAVVIGFGSYYTVPILVAAKLLKIPILLHEANSIPGKANKWFAPYAKCTGIHFPSTAKLLNGDTCEVGLPLRQGYQKGVISKIEALAYFQLNENNPIILIFGGSQGARSINKFIQEAFANNTSKIPFQIIHIAGNESLVKELTAFYDKQQIKSCVKAFETRMDYAWTVADLFIGRSGASTIAEAMEFEVPGILIPYPYATENHQEKNADFLVNDVKGAVKMLEHELSSIMLFQEIDHLINHEQKKVKQQAMQTYKQRPNQMDFCDLVMKYIK